MCVMLLSMARFISLYIATWSNLLLCAMDRQAISEYHDPNNTSSIDQRILIHELRNSIAPIVALSSIVDFGDDTLHTDTAEMLNIIYKAITHTSNILNEYEAALSNDCAAKLPYVHVPSIVSDIVSQLPRVHIAHNKPMEITPYVMPINKTKLQQLLHNLILNAARSRGSKSQVIIDYEADPDQVQVFISDNGAGISIAALNQMNVAPDLRKSHGYGLYTCNKLAQEINAMLEFKAALNSCGTCVVVTLANKQRPKMCQKK